MKECEDCGDEVRRRFQCFHCGLFICGFCWNHIHGCGPGHTRAECKHYQAMVRSKNRRVFLLIIRNSTLKKQTLKEQAENENRSINPDSKI